MNTKAEQTKGTNAADVGKLVLAGVILVAGLVGYTWLGNSAISQSVRLIGVVVALVIALAIGAFTAPGRRVRNFIAVRNAQGGLADA